jgi:hypothetical protein
MISAFAAINARKDILLQGSGASQCGGHQPGFVYGEIGGLIGGLFLPENPCFHDNGPGTDARNPLILQQLAGIASPGEAHGVQGVGGSGIGGRFLGRYDRNDTQTHRTIHQSSQIALPWKELRSFAKQENEATRTAKPPFVGLISAAPIF